MKTDLRYLLKEFHQLPKTGQDSLIKDLYNFSNETKLMITNRLVGKADFTDLIRKMRRETIDKIYRKGEPGMIDGRKINTIISSAKKARADYEVVTQLEWLAFRGFTEFLHEFGGGPYNYDIAGPRHLYEYLTLVKKYKSSVEAAVLFKEAEHYIRSKNNMNQDYNFDALEEATGIRVR